MNAPQLLDRREAVQADAGQARVDLLHEARDPDFEKLVEVRAHDGEKSHPLQQRVALALRLLQHPAVEGEPAQFPVEIGELARRLGVGFFFAGGHVAGWIAGGKPARMHRRRLRNEKLFSLKSICNNAGFGARTAPGAAARRRRPVPQTDSRIL